MAKAFGTGCCWRCLERLTSCEDKGIPLAATVASLGAIMLDSARSVAGHLSEVALLLALRAVPRSLRWLFADRA